MLMAVSAGHSRVYSRFITELTRLEFAIFYSDITIDNGSKSERSTDMITTYCFILSYTGKFSIN